MDYKVCRTCGENKGRSFIFSSNQGLQISAKIAHCCPRLNIMEEDTMPAYICSKCEEELDVAYQFILKCEATDKHLRSCFVTTAHDQKEYKPEFDVKLENSGASDQDDHFEDIPDHFSSTECNNVKIKLETHSEPKATAKKMIKKIKHSKRGDYKCSVCGHQSASPSALTIHMRNHSSERPYQCSNCDKDFKDQGNLKRHIKTHHSDQRSRDFICEQCGKGFYSKSDIKVHMRIHTGETPYICSECPAKFTQIGALIRHKKRHTGEKPHICATCGKRFCTKEELKHHSKVHSDEKNFMCPICKLPFKYKNNLGKHMILHATPNSFICNYCGQTFNVKGNLKMHINRKHSEKSGHCNICLKNVPNIEVHMWRHTGQRPLKCEYCTSSFYKMQMLARHVNYRHKYPDKFKCSVEGCGMTFPAKAMLEFHTAKLHETRIPFPCDRCSRGFYRKNDLARHKIGTHKERLAH
ncbi:zinc-finger double domain-containing protein [Phthorimaea operculella]|nr:zinc-finger double domain-containing protein [Phthorimaea operculella]